MKTPSIWLIRGSNYTRAQVRSMHSLGNHAALNLAMLYHSTRSHDGGLSSPKGKGMASFPNRRPVERRGRHQAEENYSRDLSYTINQSERLCQGHTVSHGKIIALLVMNRLQAPKLLYKVQD